MKISELRAKSLPHTDTILMYMFDFSMTDIILNQEKSLTPKELSEFNNIQNQIQRGYPLQYAIGKWNFFGEDFLVTPAVLIPRPETEILVEEVLKENLENKKVLDIGTGSGAIAISIKKNSENTEVTAVDIMEDALEIARENAKNLNTNINFIHSDLFENISEKFDIIVSNPPYLTEQEYEEVDPLLYHEPKTALVGGKMGYEIYERIIKDSKDFLFANGKLFFEIGYAQANVVANLLLEYGYSNIRVLKDYNNLDRVVVGELCLNN